jgi:hypothetical protein
MHGIDGISHRVKHLPKVVESSRFRVLLSGFGQSICIDIAQGNYIDIRMGTQGSEIRGTHPSDSDPCQPQSCASRWSSGQRGAPHERSQRGRSCLYNQVATMDGIWLHGFLSRLFKKINSRIGLGWLAPISMPAQHE